MRVIFCITFLSIVLSLSFDVHACPKGVKNFRKVLENEMEQAQIQTQAEAKISTTSIAHAGNSSSDVGVEGLVISGQETRAVDLVDPATVQNIERETTGAVTTLSQEGKSSVEMIDGVVLSSQESKSFDLTDPQLIQQAEKQPVKSLANYFLPDYVAGSKRGTNTVLSAAEQRTKVRALPSVDIFKKTYAKSTLEFENRHFIDSVGNIPKGKKAVYFDVENSVLKQLNDEIFETKDLGDAAGNLFNRILYDKIQKTPELAQKLNGKYRDFKSLRFQFLLSEGEDSTQVLNLLKKVYGESASEFERQLKATGLAPLWNARTGQTGNPEKWFLAGAGDTPLEANMAARQARGMLPTMGSSNRMILYSDRVDALATDIKKVEKIRTTLGEIPELRKANIMVNSTEGDLVLSKDAIGILRKTKRGDFKNLDEYRSAVNKQFQKIFGTKVDDISLDGMTKYFEGVDSLSPPLFVRSRTGIDLGQANHGLVSVDFTGVGVDNAYEAMSGLAKTSSSKGTNTAYVDKALRSVDGHVDNVTDSMNSSKVIFNQSTSKVTGSEKSAVFSGDDGMYFPDAKWTAESKQKLVDNLSTRVPANAPKTAKADPSKYRVTFVSTEYKEGATIPTALRSEYIVKAEKVEKDIRKAVVGLGEGKISPEKAKDMLIAIEYNPGKNSRGDWDIIFGGKVDHTDQTIIRRSLESIIEENKY